MNKTVEQNGKPLILIVEDDRVTLKSLKLRLGEKHFRFVEALNPDQALRKIQEVGRTNIAGALIDMKMPPLGAPDQPPIEDAGMPVVEFLRGLDAEYPRRGDPFIMAIIYLTTVALYAIIAIWKTS